MSDTETIHVHSHANHIWLRLRRDVPTQQDIGQPSFKTVLCLTPTQAIAIAGELLTVATRHQAREKKS